MAGRWMCAGGGGEPVRVVHGDGQVLSPTPPVRVADILDGHPHHYICHMSPELPSNKSAMLPLDYELEPGYVYFLLPLPRLFPTSAAGPPSCCCRFSNHDRSLEEGHMTPRSHMRSSLGSISVKSVKHLVDRIGSPMRSSGKKVSPELYRSPGSANGLYRNSSPLLSPTYGASRSGRRGRIFGGFSPGRRGVSCNSSPNRLRENANLRGQLRNSNDSGGRCPLFDNLCNKWRPRLGCISETESFVTACEELRLCLDRRRLTFDAKVRTNSSMKLADAFRMPPTRFGSQPETTEDEDYDDNSTKQSPGTIEDEEYDDNSTKQSPGTIEDEEYDDSSTKQSPGRMSLASYIFV